ncbi:MAG: YceI family protein [Rickettsiales bacterium]|nr:YceI family protein [Rickettsiales bacterium]
MKKILITLLALGFSLSANAADLYKVDPMHASINWTANHFGFSNQSGKITDVTGAINLDETRPQESSVDVKIGVGSLVTGLSKFDEHLKSADFLNVAKFPTATFKSTSVAPSGKNFAKVRGNLTLLGVTKPVTLDVKIVRIGTSPISQQKTIGFYATTTIKRSDFDMTFGAPGVSDSVKIVIDLEANFVASDTVKTKGAAPILSQPGNGKNAPKTIPEWKIIAQKSKLEFKASRDNSPITGSFKKFDGQITFDKNQLSKSKIQIDVDTSSVEISYSEADATLRGKDWLSVKAFPTATFTSHSIILVSGDPLNRMSDTANFSGNANGMMTMHDSVGKGGATSKDSVKPATYRANGSLNIKGRKVPATIEFSLNENSQTQASATGKLKIQRSAFGIGDRDVKRSGGVKDEVEITFTINAER